MAKDFQKTEGGTDAPSAQPDRVGPVAGHVEPESSTKVVKATPREHAVGKNLVRTRDRVARVNNEPAQFDEYSPQHLSAAVLHGWAEHEHHTGKPIALSVDDYEAALHAAYHPVTRLLDKEGKPHGEPVDSLRAANEGKQTITDYEPHKPAVSPHKGKGL